MDIVYRFSTEAAASLKQPRSNREALKILASGNERFAQTVEHLQKMS